MNKLEPLCNFEQRNMLHKLGMRDFRPTISLAKNWLYEKYGLWIEATYSPEMQQYCARIWTEDVNPFCGNNANPMIAESDCLTEVLKKLVNEKSNS